MFITTYHKPPLLGDTFLVSFILPLDSEILGKCSRSKVFNYIGYGGSGGRP